MNIDSVYVAVSNRKRVDFFWHKVFQIEDREGNVVEFYSGAEYG